MLDWNVQMAGEADIIRKFLIVTFFPVVFDDRPGFYAWHGKRPHMHFKATTLLNNAVEESIFRYLLDRAVRLDGTGCYLTYILLTVIFDINRPEFLRATIVEDFYSDVMRVDGVRVLIVGGGIGNPHLPEKSFGVG